MRALEQVQATLDDWQEIFALRNGALSAGPDVVAPRELALAATSLVDEWVGGPGVSVRLIPGEATPISTDRRKITRLLATLLLFAETRAPESQVTLTVRADDGGGTVHFQVRDAGPDLGREQVEALFDPLAPAVVRGRYRVNFALLRALAAHLGGTLVAAALPGQGLQVTCSLPSTTRS
ncbi:MAG: hypothetical protein JNJ98_10600 [Gemmatimonadetes bacterium]|nr:hypothetical protein [Gemmatimonadota bacterium]